MFGHILNIFLTELGRSVWENLDLGRWYRPHSVRSYTGDLGQDSPIQTDLARLIRCLLYGQTRKQRNKNMNNFICFPARAQAFSWLSSVTGLQSKRNKNNCSKSSFVQTLFKQANLLIFFVCNFLRRTVTTRSV